MTADWITIEICDSKSMIHCQKQFHNINYVTFCWLTCSFMQPAMLKFNKRKSALQWGSWDNSIQMFIWGGILSDLWSEIKF